MFLLEDSEEAVTAELERLKELRENHGVSTGESAEKSQSWVKLHMKIAEKSALAEASQLVAGKRRVCYCTETFG